MIKIFLRGEGRELRSIEIDEDALVKDITVDIEGSEVHLFIEDEEIAKHKHNTAKEACIKHHDQVHCHRCNEIATTIQYNGVSKELKLAPGTTGAKILSLVPKEFNITPVDAADLQLELPDNAILGSTDHIGTYVKYPNCSIALSLNHKPQIKG